MSEPSTSGGCLCGGVRFALTEPAREGGYCHCTRCQKRTGSASSAQVRIEGSTFRLLSGEELVKCWSPPSGAHLFSRNPDDPSEMSVRMAAFDGDPGVRLSWRAFTAYAAPWEPIPDDGLERFAEAKPRR